MVTLTRALELYFQLEQMQQFLPPEVWPEIAEFVGYPMHPGHLINSILRDMRTAIIKMVEEKEKKGGEDGTC